jgi:hypothetical protein
MKTYIHYLILLLILIPLSVAHSQILIDNEKDIGKINNERGIIKFKKTGALIDLPDTILGTVIYESKQFATDQVVPNITYSKLIFDATSRLRIDTFSTRGRAMTRPLTVLDSFIIRSGDSSRIRNNYIEIHNQANVRTNGHLQGRRDVAMVSQHQKQSIHGENNASFSHLRIENPHGVDIEGSLYVTNKLELRDGQVRNLDTNNIKIGDTTINRSTDNLSFELSNYKDDPGFDSDSGDTT